MYLFCPLMLSLFIFSLEDGFCWTPIILTVQMQEHLSFLFFHSYIINYILQVSSCVANLHSKYWSFWGFFQVPTSLFVSRQKYKKLKPAFICLSRARSLRCHSVKRPTFSDKRNLSVSQSSTAFILQWETCTSDGNLLKQCEKAKMQCLT